MSTKNNCQTLTRSSVALAVAAALSPQMVQAQDSVSDAMPIEEITVIGYRGSLFRSLEQKRNSSEVLDTVASEDIGKFPDENVAQSLQRIAGVAINRPRGSDFGGGSNEGRIGGQFVSIRGLPPEFAQVTLNGRSLATGRNLGRQFSLDILPSEFISRLDVYKTQPADQLEGGIAGVVDIVTHKPLDLNNNQMAFSGEAVHGDLADSYDPRLSGVASFKNDSETLGFLLAATYSERSTREDEYFSWGNVNFGPGTGDGLDERTDLATIQGGIDDGVIEFPTATYPIEPLTQYYVDDRERQGLNSVLQWRPNDSVDVTWDAFYATYDVEEDRSQLPARFQFRGPQDPEIALTIGPNINDPNGRGRGGIFPFYAEDIVIGSNNTLVSASVPQTQWRSQTLDTIVDSSTFATGVNFDWHVNDKLNANFDISYSVGEQYRDLSQVTFQTFADTIYDSTIRDSGVPLLTAVGHDFTDPSNWRVSHGSVDTVDTEDESTAFSVDFDYQFDGFFRSIETGLRFANRQKTVGVGRDNVTAGASGISPNISATEAGLGTFPIGDFLSNASGVNLIREWVIGLPREFNGNFGEAPVPVSVSSFDVDEGILSLYLKGSFDFDMGSVPVTGQIGVRYVQTDVVATGALPEQIVIRSAGDFDILGERSSTESDYDSFLPSLSLRASLSDDLLLRFAAARTITRPTLTDLSPRFTFNSTTLTATSGNPALEPFESDSYDISLEWYFAPGALASVSAFYKDVGGFIFSAGAPETVAGVDWMIVNRPRNAAEAEISGFEINLQSDLLFLPAPFDGLGIVANYTYSGSSTGFPPDSVVPPDTEFQYPGLSENIYNFVLYYENGPLDIRLAQNYRDEFLLDAVFGGFAGSRHTDSYSQLDLSASYRVNDNLTLTLSGVNLTNSRFERYFNGDPTIIANTNFTGRQLYFGGRVAF